jgi:hypothetical protein
MNWKVYSLLGLVCIGLAGYIVWQGADNPDFAPTTKTKNQNKNIIKEETTQENKTMTQDSPRYPANAILSEKDFLKKYPGNWLFKRVEKGRLNYITGGNIPDVGRSPQSVRDFMAQISPLLEVSPKELTETQETSRTDLTRVYQSKQITDGYTVYQSMLSVHVRESDNSVFMINNQLKDVSGYNKEQRFTQKQAETYIQTHYAGEYEKIVFRDGPVIFKTDSVSPELAYVFIMTYKQPKLHQVELVIGAYSGEEIYRQNVNIQ